MNTKSRTKAIELVSTGIAILLSFSSMHSVAWAGPGSTGGGLSDASGDLLDFGEATNSKVKAFYPAKSDAFKEVLLPILKKLNAKLPGAASALLVGLPPNMEWYLADLPIANSSDECKLFKEESYQIAKQVDGEVGLPKSWMESHSKEQQAGLILHELIMFTLQKAPNDCATRVRRAVRAIFNVDQLSDVQLQAELGRIGIYLHSKTESDRIIQLSRELLKSYCQSPAKKSKAPAAKPAKLPASGGLTGSGVWGTPQPTNDSRTTELANMTYSDSSSNAISTLHIYASNFIFQNSLSDEESCKKFEDAITVYSDDVASFPAIN